MFELEDKPRASPIRCNGVRDVTSSRKTVGRRLAVTACPGVHGRTSENSVRPSHAGIANEKSGWGARRGECRCIEKYPQAAQFA
jgi:hypothetical protein